MNGTLLTFTQTISRLPKYSNSQDPNDLQGRIIRVEGQSDMYEVFLDEISKLSVEERRRARFGTLDFLWEHIPRKDKLSSCIGDADDPGDGIIYNSDDVAELDALLGSFRDAWRHVSSASKSTASNIPTLPTHEVDNLTNMSRIFLVLRGMNQMRVSDFFRDHSITDGDLPIDKETLHTILPKKDALHATTFHAEQYRAVSRQWRDGEQLEIEDECEPLPLLRGNELGEGSFAKVTRSTHMFEGIEYAHKEHVTSEHVAPEARAHLETEIERIKKLQHLHVIRYVKSWRRGNKCGVLLEPAASTDLRKYLKRYESNAYNPQRDTRERFPERAALEPTLLNAFGCLSLGLLHIHDRNVRHKDIKPANILLDHPHGHTPRFLWADFGLAYDFGDREHSRTVSGSIYSPKYAAPEVAASAAIANQRRGSQTPQSISATLQLSNQESPSESQVIGPGRPSDIFSFGCVFLEILSYLVAGADEELDRSEFKAFNPFYKSIEDLQAWARTKLGKLSTRKLPLRVLFQLGIQMVSESEEDRPTISAIVSKLKDTGAVYFCQACQHETDTTRNENAIRDMTSAQLSLISPADEA